ncbi:MAG TPA: hypothetical protein VI033_03600 [Candidatus Nitrosopolaris sp.]
MGRHRRVPRPTDNYRVCLCGCGQEVTGLYHGTNGYVARKYVLGHHVRGLTGSKKNGWKGDNIKPRHLRYWVRTHKPKPLDNKCQYEQHQDERCNNPANDLTNVTGIYNRDNSNWKYFCRHHSFIVSHPHHREHEDFISSNKGRKLKRKLANPDIKIKISRPSSPRKGVILSQEIKDKMSATMKSKKIVPWNKGRKLKMKSVARRNN